jgi:cytochrome c
MRPWTVATLTVAAVVGMGFVHPFGNPRTEPHNGLGALLQGANMPADAKTVLVKKCADCHSNETQWPVYARVAPGSWLIERDVVEGRKHLNFSRWQEIPADQQQVLTAKIVQAARSGDMPPTQYLLLHRYAKLTQSDLQKLAMLGKSAGGSEAALVGEGDALHGRVVFEKRCIGCHATEVDREGPRLAGVYGRKSGSVAGFTYSPGLKSLGVTWNDVTLEKWLNDPDVMVRNNNMSFSVPKAEERRDLIAYLKQLSL